MGIIGFILAVYLIGSLTFFVSYCISASMTDDIGSTESSIIIDAAKKALVWPKVIVELIRKGLIIKK